MSIKYYIDSCIWRDYFEDREDNLRPLGEWAFLLLKKIIENEDLIVFSDLNEEELLVRYSIEQIKKIISIVPPHLLIKIDTKNLTKRARSLQRTFGVHFNDALHFTVAEENNCILITRDKHFERLKYIGKIKKPEELL